MFWTIKDIDFSQDLSHLKTLSSDEMHYITHVLAFFAQSDGIVNENLAMRFYQDVEIPEARAFYSDQMQREAIHAWAYALLIDTYVKDNNEKQRLFNAIEHIPAVKKKAEWAIRWIDSQADFAKRLIAFAVVEGIFFSGAFCSIFWLKKQGLMPGLTTSNEFISRDEGMHTDFACILYSKIINKLKKSQVNKIIKEAVTIRSDPRWGDSRIVVDATWSLR
jgi:ribonucleotide reductase beta subunit family protein with ferritin-like domain